jgi:hypothetical protein
MNKYRKIALALSLTWIVFWLFMLGKEWVECDGHLVRTLFFVECVVGE